MMKKIFALVFALVVVKCSFSQTYPLQQNLGSDSTIVISKGALQSRLIPIVVSDTTAANAQRMKNYPGAQLYTTNGNFYIRNSNATKWVLVSSGSSGPVNIYNSDGTLTGNRVLTGAGNSILFNGVSGFGVNKAPDSVFTVDGGIHATGGLRLDNLASSPGTKSLRINSQGQVTIADTTISGGTVTSVGSGYGLSGGPITTSGTLLVDSATLSNYYLRKKDSLTATNSLGYVTKKILADTAAAIRASDAGGSVTSVATNNGTGITGGTITTSGTLAIDTTVISTRAWRQKGVDSLQANINQKLNISDTASMLNPYLRKVDTASLSNRINQKLNISDTAAMLSPYLRSNTAAATYVPLTRNLTINGTTQNLSADRTFNVGTVTSVALTMPSAFNVAGSPVTSSGTLAVTGAGLASQYIRGDGTLANFPGGGGGGGSSVSYYLNGSVNQGTFGGNTYYQMNKTPVIGAGTNFTIAANGYIAQFITNAGDPALLNIPAGNWNFEMYFSASSAGGNPQFYVELYKYDGTTFTLIASGAASPESITGGTVKDLYLTSLAVPATSLTLTDRLAVRVYILHDGRTITLHTEDQNLCQVITTFTTGITAINSLTAQVQYLTTGTSGTDFNISSLTDTHTFNLPVASATNTGKLSSANWTTFNNKIGPSDTASMLAPYLRKADTTAMLTNYLNNVGYGLSRAGKIVSADSATLSNYYLRRKDSLTSTNLLGYVTRKVLSDTAAAIRSADAGGTVTSVATNNGTGITGGTITTSGTLAIDTLLISTRAWRQKGIDSVAALANTKIGGSGTINRVSKFTASGTIGNSSIADSSSSVAMTILSNGNIGIGSTAPTSKLEVAGNTSIQGNFANLSLDNTTSTTPIWMKINNGGGNYLIGAASNAGGSIITSTSPYAFVINAESSRDVVIGTNNLERVRFDSTGKVGIGTTTIDSMLTVAQGVRFQRGVRMSGLPSAPGTKALRIDANGTLSIADTTTGGGGSGTVTSVATNNGTGITGGTITTAGTLAIDTLLISTRAWRQKGIDSLAAIRIAGSGTTNYIAKFTSSTAVGNSVMFDTGTGIVIGNGQSSATPQLGLIEGTDGSGTNIAGAEFRIQGGQGTGTGAGGPITFYTSVAGTSGSATNTAAERMRIDAAGNLGLGVTPAAFALSGLNVLQVRNAGFSGYLNNAYVTANVYYDVSGNARHIANGFATEFVNQNGEFFFYGSTSGTAGNLISSSLRMSINSSGNIGIATNNIGSRLQINGNAAIGYSASTAAPTNGLAVSGNVGIGTTSPVSPLTIYNATNPSVRLQNSTSGTLATDGADIFTDGSDFWVRNIESGIIAFATANTERMRITSGGNVGIGTTTIGSTFQVNGNAAIGYSASTAAPTNGLAVSGVIGVGSTSVTNGTSWGGANQFNLLKLSSIGYPALEINTTTDGGGSLQFTTGTNLPNQVKGLIGYNSGTGTVNEFNVYNFANGSLLFGTNNAERMRINSSGVVFIGNGETASSPSTGIISGTGGTGTNIAGAEFRIRGGASTGSAAGGPITFYTSAAGTAGTGVNAATERMRIDALGNLGLGVTPSTWMTAFKAIQIGARTSIYNSDINYTGIINNAYYDGSFYRYLTTAAISSIEQGAGVITFATAPSGTAGATVSSLTEKMRITNTGTVGIGTATIGSTLQVNGNAAIGYSASTAAPTNGLAVAGNVGVGTTTINAALQVTGASGTGFFTAQRLDNTTNNAYQSWSFGGSTAGGIAGFVNANILEAVPFSTGNFVISAFSNNLVFMTNNRNERMRLTSDGQMTLSTGSNVSAIAQTGYSLTGSNASSLLDLAGTWNTTGNPTALKLNITNTASGATSKLMDLQVGGTSQFQVTKGGAIQTVGGVPWKLNGSVVTLGGSNLQGISVDVNGTIYYLVTGYLPEPEPDPAAAPASGPSGNYKAYNKPTPTRSIQDTKIAALEKELAELKEMIKSIKK